MVCFFGKSRASLFSPMVSRNTCGSNLAPFLGVGGGRVEFRVRRDFRSIGVGTAIFVERLDSRGEAVGTPPVIQHYYPPRHRVISGGVPTASPRESKRSTKIAV